ncbi:hypothetical protein Slin14017_G026490 [Septoria linicola]|nr:hypothetical protein Slin14017_G026490 [Septoria linicola]
MRCFAVVPILLLTAALILTFLCLFAGHKQGFLENFQILSLNVSQLGEQSFLTVTQDNSEIGQLFGALPENVQSAISQGVNTAAQSLGIPEFYNVNIMTVCQGDYDPNALAEDASRNVTDCSDMRAGYRFDPRDQIQDEIDARGLNIDISQLGWPDALDDALSVVEPITLGAFVLYVVNCAVIFIALIFSIMAIFTSGRLSACCNVGFNLLAFLISAATSAIITVVAVYGSDLINQYGEEYGVLASSGTSFLILTWFATGCLLVTALLWCVDCCCLSGRRKRKSEPKYG